MQRHITFDENVRPFILECFGATTDMGGWLIYRKTGRAITDPEGAAIHISNFAGLIPNPTRWYSGDLVSIIQMSDAMKESHG